MSKNWYFARDNLIDWADTLIIGSSVASAGINPDILEKNLNRKHTVWNIAQPGDTASIDYFNLERILATCRKCPQTIVYLVAQTSFEKGEPKSWQGEVYDNIERLYIDTKEENETLKEAADYDSFYNEIYNTMLLNRAYRPYFLRRQLTGMVKKKVYEYMFGKSSVSASQILEVPQVGYFDRMSTMTKANAGFGVKLLAKYFKDYEVGRANELFFERFVLAAKKSNIRVVFVQMPISPIYFENFNAVENKFRRNIKPLLEKLRITPIDDTYSYKDYALFSDLHHLNYKGAKKYTLHLANEMNKQK